MQLFAEVTRTEATSRMRWWESYDARRFFFHSN